MLKRLLFFTIIGSTLLSCKKEVDDPQPVLPELKISEFNLRHDTFPKVTEFELIISQKDGKVLLDTLIASHKSHTLRIKSVDTQFNVTTLQYDPATQRYGIKTYLQVIPNEWHINSSGSPAPVIDAVKSYITYINLPGYDDSQLFITRVLGSYRGSWPVSKYEVNYDRYLANDIAYLLLPKYGKYILADINSTQTTVDFSKALNTVKIKYNRPAGISGFGTHLQGYSNDGVRDYRMRIFGISGATPTAEYDLQYPTTGFDKFDLNVVYHDKDKYWHMYNSIATGIPTEIDFLEKSDFAVSNSGFDDFQVTLETDRPSTYSTLWTSTDADFKATWQIHFSPDEVSFKPKTFLENIKSKTLAGNMLPTFKLSEVISEKVKNRNHQAMMDYQSNPTVRINNPITYSRRISKLY